MNKAKYTHEEMVDIMFADSKVKQAYDEMKDEFSLLRIRLMVGKTQQEVS